MNFHCWITSKIYLRNSAFIIQTIKNETYFSGYLGTNKNINKFNKLSFNINKNELFDYRNNKIIISNGLNLVLIRIWC